MSTLRHFPMFIVVLILALMLPTALISAQDGEEEETPDGNFTIVHTGTDYDAGADQTTFTYVVSGTGVPPDLSHFNLAIPQCETPLEVAGFSPTGAVELGTDPTTGVTGIKWDIPLLTTDSRTYSITFVGEVLEGITIAAVKGGPGFFAVGVPGPICDEPQIQVEKFVSNDGETWIAASSAPGLVVDLEDEVFFRFLVTNTGTSTLTDITLEDSVFDTESCEIPEALEPEEVFECVVGPFPAEEDQHTNTVTVTATADDDEIVSTSADGFYFGGEYEADEDLPITIIIEGPVEAIIGNIIVIFGINIELDPDDPILLTIQIGDILRIEGDTISEGDTIIIIAVIIVIIDQQIIEDDTGEWVDTGSCANPPPPWAPAHGWRARCEGAPHPGMGMGMGR